MVKIFIGNLSEDTGKDELEALFASYGTVTECAKYRHYAFVHMEDRKCATKAIRELHLHELDGMLINVEPSRGKNQGAVKLHVASVEKEFEKELQELFEQYGTVTECAVVRNFAFVHMSNSDEAMDALQALDNSEFQGKRIHVQISRSRPRGYTEEDYPPVPARGASYPSHYPGEMPEPPYGGHMSAYLPPPPPPPPLPPPPPPRQAPYPARAYGVGGGGFYENYSAHSLSSAGYDPRRAIPPPPPPSALVREHLGIGSQNSFERHPLPPPTSYAVRDRSPIRRVPLPPTPTPTPGNGYSYERSRLSPVSKIPVYTAPRLRDSLPPPPPPHYTDY